MLIIAQYIYRISNIGKFKKYPTTFLFNIIFDPAPDIGVIKYVITVSVYFRGL